MNRLDAPDIDEFTARSSHQAFGLDYLRMESRDGVGLDLSTEGIIEVDRNPRLSSLLARMGQFIAEHDGYKDLEAIKEAETGKIMLVADSKPDYHGGMRLASVYHHDSAPEAVIKAFDYDKALAAPMQFYAGAWLHRGLARQTGAVRCPQQWAMLTAPGSSNHKTTVMEYMPGRSLSHMYNTLRSAHGHEAVKVMLDAAEAHVGQEIGRALGRQGLMMANDLTARNIIVEVDESHPVVPEEITDFTLSLIDQPRGSIRGMATYGILRALSTTRRRRLPYLSNSESASSAALPEKV